MGKSEILQKLREEFTFIGSEELTGSNALQIIEGVFEDDSHSPTEPEFDTLQEGDWFQGTEEQIKKLLDMTQQRYNNHTLGICVRNGIYFSGAAFLTSSQRHYYETQLTPGEFMLRAENTKF